MVSQLNFKLTGRPGWLNELLDYLTTHTSLSPIRSGFVPGFVNYKLEAQWYEPVSLTFHSALRKFNTEPSIGASHHISAHFGKSVSDKKIFRN
jgi:hypothetical protein